jgi:hypothetical protein
VGPTGAWGFQGLGLHRVLLEEAAENSAVKNPSVVVNLKTIKLFQKEQFSLLRY